MPIRDFQADVSDCRHIPAFVAGINLEHVFDETLARAERQS